MKAKNLNFGIFYEHEDEKSYFILLIRKYLLVDIQYICNIKKIKFKLENIMKLSTHVRCTRKTAISLKIGTNGLKIEAMKEDYTTADVKGIISLLQAFHIYIQILIFLATLRNKLQL